MGEPRVSILILTRDGGETLGRALDAVSSQEAGFEHEIVAIDSGSQDGSVEMLRAAGARVKSISPAEFGHGRTRNVGVALCRGDWVVLLVQDAVPQSTGWLRALTAPLEEDERVAGTFARQVARKDASAVTRCNLERWVAGKAEGRVRALDDREAFLALPPMEQHDACVMDNVCSCIRRSVWERHPFPEVPIAEDLAWGRAVLLAGLRLVYEPRAVVEHSHERSWRYELHRTYLLHRQLGAMMALRTVPSLGHLARAIVVSCGAHLRCHTRERGALFAPGALIRALGLAVVWPLGQYLGGRAWAEGRDLLHPRGV